VGERALGHLQMAAAMHPPIKRDKNRLVGSGRKRGGVNTAGSAAVEEEDDEGVVASGTMTATSDDDTDDESGVKTRFE
jgi:hypothetical protein